MTFQNSGFGRLERDSRSEYRWQKISLTEVDLRDLKKINLMEDSDELSEKLKNVTIGTENHTCGDCGGAFKSEGYLKLQREKKHGDIVKPFVCTDCNKILQSKRNLDEAYKKDT